MNTYARIENGIVTEIIRPLTYDDGAEIPVELRFEDGFVRTLVSITNEDPMPADWWTFDEARFYPPVVGGRE